MAPISSSQAMAAIGVLALAGSIIPAFGCQVLKVTAGDGRSVVGRDMQFALKESEFKSHWRTHSRGNTFHTVEGSSWPIKHGYLGVEMFDLDDTIDGVNTKGLQCSGLYFPGFAKFQKVCPNYRGIVVPQLFFCDYVLGNFQSVQEVNASVPLIKVVTMKMPDGNQPLHWSVTDRAGNSVIVEYVKGQLSLYNNFVGVMTNSPPYDWHLLQLQMWAPTMNSTNPSGTTYGDVTFAPQGNWGSMMGLPGDFSPSSRFIRQSVMLHFAGSPRFIPTQEKAVLMMQHMLNAGDQVNGTLIDLDALGEYKSSVASDWTVIYDLNGGVLFRSYESQVWQFINMSALDFSKGAREVRMSAYDVVPPPDVTGQMKPISLAKTGNLRAVRQHVADSDQTVFMQSYMAVPSALSEPKEEGEEQDSQEL